MIRQRLLVLVASGTLALGALSACGGSTTATSPQPAAPDIAAAPAVAAGTVPVYPDAKPFDSSNPMAMAVDQMKQQMAQQQANATVDIYELPADTSFEQVKSFYGDELGKQGYNEVTAGQPTATPQGAMAVWTDAQQSAVSVMVMENPLGGSILIVAEGQAQ